MTDDSGNFIDGTEVDEAFIDSIFDAIDGQVHDPANPTTTPSDTTAEVVAARGSAASLEDRFDVAHEASGQLRESVGLVTSDTASSLAFRNLVPNGDFLLWSQGDAAAPDYWTLSGAGAAVARTGTGLGDTIRPGNFGDFAAKITYGSASAKLTHSILDATAFARVTNLRGRTVSVMVWARTLSASIARIAIDDGETITTSAFHPGTDSEGEMLTLVHTIHADATKLDIFMEVAGAGNAHFQDLCVVLSDLPPADFIPCEMQKGVIHLTSAGTLTTGTAKGVFAPDAPGIITDVQLRVETAPTGAALIVDVNTYDGAAMTTAFTTKPQIAAAGLQGGAAPDGTYARRCFRTLFGATLTAGSLLNFDIDQIGSGAAGANLIVEVRIRQYVRVFEGFLSYNA